jgi:hypothetical protein
MLETQRASAMTSERACHRHLQVRSYPLGTTFGLEQRPVQVPNPPTIGAQRVSAFDLQAVDLSGGWLVRPPGDHGAPRRPRGVHLSQTPGAPLRAAGYGLAWPVPAIHQLLAGARKGQS